MSDLISRVDAIDKIFEVYEYEFLTASGEFDEFVTVIIPNILRNLPSAESERKGEWLEKEVFDNVDYEIPEWQSEKCSVCGKYHTTPYLYNFRTFAYCPNCGSKMMRGEE